MTPKDIAWLAPRWQRADPMDMAQRGHGNPNPDRRTTC